MDAGMLQNLLALSSNIKVSLRAIQNCQSLKDLLPVFKDFTVKLLQFSAIIKQIKKKSKNELDRKNLVLLLHSLKRDILELSNASQAYLKEKGNYERKKIQTEVIGRIEYAIDESVKIVQRLQGSSGAISVAGLRKAEVQRQSQHDLSTDLASSILSSRYSASTNTSEITFYSQSLHGVDETSADEMQDIISKGKYLMKQAKRLVDGTVHKTKEFGNYTAVLEESTLLTNRVENFCQITSNFMERFQDHVSTDIRSKLRDLQELVNDLASISLSCYQSQFDDKEYRSIYKLYTALDRMLADIIEALKDEVTVPSKIEFDETCLQRSLNSLKKLSAEKNVIGITEVTSMFIDAVRQSEKELRNNFAEDGLTSFNRAAIRKEISNFEKIANDVIIDVENQSSVDSLQQKMVEIFECISNLKLTAEKELHKRQSALTTLEVAKESQQLENSQPSTEVIMSDQTNGDEKPFIDQLSLLFIAVNDNDYRIVERFASYLMDDVKKIGNILRKIHIKSSKSLSDLQICYEKYFKLTGIFCSQARKAVLADEPQQSLENLRKTARELGEKRETFFKSCKTALKPWIDIPLSAVKGTTTTTKTANILADFTSRIDQIIETMKATEYFQHHQLREETLKMQKIISDSASFISSSNKPTKPQLGSQSYRLEVCCLHWSCSVLCIFGILDKLIENHKSYTAKKTNKQYNGEISSWVLMLKDLAYCCTDEEINSEIADRITDLENFKTKLESVAEVERCKEHSMKQIDLTLLKKEISCKAILLTELIDILTRDVSEPMKTFVDPLASLSFASSLSCFNELRDAFQTKMETVETMACLAVEDSPSKAQSHLVFQAVDELMLISEELLIFVSKPNNDENKCLELLKLRWRSKATYLIKVLMTVPEVRFTAVSGVMRHLQSASHVGHLDELVDILRDVGSPLKPYPQHQDARSTQSFPDFFGDEDSILSSALDYPLSKDTDILSSSSPRLESADIRYFQQHFEDTVREEDENRCHLPFNHSPETFHPLSSTVSTRSSSSQTQDTEIYIETPSRVSPSRLPRNHKNWGLTADPDESQTSERSLQSTELSESMGKVDQSSSDAIKQSFLNKDSRISKSIAAAAEILKREVEKWEEDGNSVVTVVKQMSNQMLQMADYAKGKGRLRSKIDFINTAKAIAANAKMVAKFAIIIADHCCDETCQANLLHYAELVPTISTQLKIIASVKAATPDDETADIMLIGNAENLMKSVLATLKAAESASVKTERNQSRSLRNPKKSKRFAQETTETFKKDQSDSTKGIQSKSAALTLQWKRKRDWQRTMESYNAETNELGLKISTNSPVLSIADL